MTDIFEEFVARLMPRMLRDTSGYIRVQFDHGQWKGVHNISMVDGEFMQKDIDEATAKARGQLVEKLQSAAEQLGAIEKAAHPVLEFTDDPIEFT